MTPRPYDELCSLSRIAELTGKAENTVRWWRSHDRGPRMWLNGGTIVAWRSDVMDWLAAQENSTSTGGVR